MAPSHPPDEEGGTFAVALLITVAMAMAGMNIYRAVRPALDNDISRWLTVRALVERGDYVIGTRLESPDGSFVDTGLMTEPSWNTVDKVLPTHSRDFRSDKPPLFSTAVAAQYWVLYRMGWWFPRDTSLIVRTVLVLTNWLPFGLYLVLLARLLRREAAALDARMFLVGAAAFGTFLHAFLPVLTNHTVGTFSTLFAVYGFAKIWRGENSSSWLFAMVGATTAWTFACELPAACLLAVLGGFLMMRFPRPTLCAFLPSAILVLLAFCYTNYLAYGTIELAYGHGWLRYPGSYWLQPVSVDIGESSRAVYAFHYLVGHHGLFSLTPIWLLAIPRGFLPPHADDWRRTVREGLGVFLLVTLSVTLRHWVSTTIALLPVLAYVAVRISLPWRWWLRPEELARVLSRVSFGVTIPVLAFWLTKTLTYGGVTVGPRHLLFLTPLWLLAMAPTCERLVRTRAGKVVLALLLAASVFSAAYPEGWPGPWQHPWIYQAWGLD